MISLLVMTIVGCSNPSNVAHFMGGVEDQCQHGRRVVRGARLRPVRRLVRRAERRRVGAHLPRPPRVRPAARAGVRGAHGGARDAMGGGRHGRRRGGADIANSWFLRFLDTSVAVEDQAAKLYRRTCREVHRQRVAAGAPQLDSNGKPAFWTGPDFAKLAEGSSRTRRSSSCTTVCKKAQFQRVLRARGAVGHRPELRVGRVRAHDARVLQGARAVPRPVRRRVGGGAAGLCDAREQARALGRLARRGRLCARPRRLQPAHGRDSRAALRGRRVVQPSRATCACARG